MRKPSYPAEVAGAASDTYYAGVTRSGDFPTENAFQPSHAGSWDVVVGAIDQPDTAPETLQVTTDYTYDPLNRLTAADYTSGEFFHYTYDAVGNPASLRSRDYSRLTEETHDETNIYTYDIANRLTSVNGVSYTWDDNGNLLDDGASAFSYDHANRLVGVTQVSDNYSFAYNGMGDRLQQSVNGDPSEYTLDINRGLTQVLSDGDNAYLYGLNRIGEEQLLGWQYHLPDAIRSVRVLPDESANIHGALSFTPFGFDLSISGTGSSTYRFAGEVKDESGLYHLRARYLDTQAGRFTQSDPSRLESNPFTYAKNNPATFVDPSGLVSVEIWSAAFIERDLIVLPHFESLFPPIGWAFARFTGDSRSYYRGHTLANCRMHNPAPSSRLCHHVVLEFSAEGVEQVINTSGTGRSRLTYFDIRSLRRETIEETAAKPEIASVVNNGCLTRVALRAEAAVPTEPELLQILGPIVYEYRIRFDRCLGRIQVNGLHTQYP